MLHAVNGVGIAADYAKAWPACCSCALLVLMVTWRQSMDSRRV